MRAVSTVAPRCVNCAKSRPTLLRVQEWWGITPEIKAQAEYISQQGPVLSEQHTLT